MNCVRILAFAPLATLAAPVAAQEKSPLALTHVSVVNVADGSVKPDMTVLVQGSRIRAVGPTTSVSIPAAAVVVNASGKFLIPGLWDMHVHSAARVSWHFPLLVAYGVTGVRNMHTTADTALELIRSVKRRLVTGELLGPRFLANGPLVDGDPSVWEGAVRVRTAAEGRAVVDSLAARGADFIKVYDNVPRDAYFAIADQARRRGIPLVGHVPFRIRPEEAARAGQRTDEHASGLSFGCSTRADSIRAESVRFAGRAPSMPFADALVAGFRLERALYDTREASRCAATIEAYRQNHVAVVPTLVIARNPNYPELILSDTASMRFIPVAVRREWEGLAGPGLGDTLRPLLRPTIPARLENVRQVTAAGVLILAGTDLGNPLLVPGVSLHQELEMLVEAGLTPLEGLRSATLNAAKFLAATDSLGTIESGKLADLVLVEANPLENITNTRKIAAVVLNGRYFDRRALDALLAGAELEAGRR
jgi:hypothetical protein